MRERIYAAVRRIPAGRVATYGGLARALGMPRGAREVGRALAALPEGSDVPWWRVVGRRGLSLRGAGLAEQRRRLLAEGVDVADDGSFEPDRYEVDVPISSGRGEAAAGEPVPDGT